MDEQSKPRVADCRALRSTRLLSATLLATVSACCSPGNVPVGVVPNTMPPPPRDTACTDAQKSDPAVVKCCLVVTKPEDQRSCTAPDLQTTNRCCPE